MTLKVYRLKDGNVKIIDYEKVNSQFKKRRRTRSKISGGLSLGDLVKCYLHNRIAEIVRIHTNGDLELSCAGELFQSNIINVKRYYGGV